MLCGSAPSACPEHCSLLGVQSGEEIPFGLCVWSTGVGPTDFTTSLPFAKTPKGVF